MSKIHGVKKKILVNMLIIVVLLSSLLVFPASATWLWGHDRPSEYTVYDETIGNAYTDGIGSIGMGVHIIDYFEAPTPDVDDLLRFRISVHANTRKEIYYDVSSDSTIGMRFLS